MSADAFGEARLAFLSIAVQVHEGALWPRSGGRHTLNECMS